MKVKSGFFSAVLIVVGLSLLPRVARANGDPVLSYFGAGAPGRIQGIE